MEVETVVMAHFDTSTPAFPRSVDARFVSGTEIEASMVVDVPAALRLEAPKNIGGCDGTLESKTSEVMMMDGSEVKAATKVQKVYRSYRTRRRLADSAVVVEELWWQAIDYVRLNHSTVSFFNYLKPETAISRWNRVSLNASKVGNGLSKDERALKLAFQHWIEAIDPRHRYGHNLHCYFDEWCSSKAGQPFFYWLDLGEGRNVDIKECPRAVLKQQCIKYLGRLEREQYEYVPIDGKIVHKLTGELLHTSKDSGGGKWIFVMSTSKKLYAGEKKKGMFHHSSFLAGGATLAAGRLTAENGVLKCIWAYSGHYRPTEENLNNFLSFLSENGVNIGEVQIPSSSNEDYYDDSTKQDQPEKITRSSPISRPPQLIVPVNNVMVDQIIATEVPQNDKDADEKERKGSIERTLSGGLQSPVTEVPRKEILKRIESKGKSRSYQLGHQLSLKWCTGAGPRIGCVADYPVELRVQALEFVNLSPRDPSPLSYRCLGSYMSPSRSLGTPLLSSHSLGTPQSSSHSLGTPKSNFLAAVAAANAAANAVTEDDHHDSLETPQSNSPPPPPPPAAAANANAVTEDDHHGYEKF
ncbi:IQ motif EF-hand binding site domain-containing protein [Dioscorea alata]|uniref:IQ motif EF-hand binding site domain-containing protein n=1 Tax=Dioscorea alata TaxID=55571 RepID=A0ACB7VZQ2_DIOAL|nr:IQ motif EF-hand binding site domain-containing protein [Dioscorea alata]